MFYSAKSIIFCAIFGLFFCKKKKTSSSARRVCYGGDPNSDTEISGVVLNSFALGFEFTVKFKVIPLK